MCYPLRVNGVEYLLSLAKVKTFRNYFEHLAAWFEEHATEFFYK